jgi:hypothetical protein
VICNPRLRRINFFGCPGLNPRKLANCRLRHETRSGYQGSGKYQPSHDESAFIFNLMTQYVAKRKR